MTANWIAPKPFVEYTPDEYHSYVSSMYALRVKRGAKPPSPAPGLSVCRTKAGALSLRKTKARTFCYVTLPEIAALAKVVGCGQADLWNLFKKKEYVIAKTRMEAERIYADINEIPWR